jgi:hypothetical protein
VRDNGAGYDPNFAAKLFGRSSACTRLSEFPGTASARDRSSASSIGMADTSGPEGQIEGGACFYFTLRGFDRSADGRDPAGRGQPRTTSS